MIDTDTEIVISQNKRINVLSADTASQIAAGEVIERPASVLKELLENSIDSGATQIDITIQRGGIQLIEVRDNGNGIVKEDLVLALKQHATSKIDSAQDLVGINSLGFRGEALASINSVARLTITSQTRTQDQAWSICREEILAAAHPIGTTVSMRDLFYNVPVRRKFLRSERTEYQHLEEVFRRIALSRFDLGFSLTAHDKNIKNLPACKDLAAETRRLINLCGQQVMANAVTIDAEQNGLKLRGWLGLPQDARSQEAHQYFFINNRVIRDRLINHAIRQVYQPLCLDGKMPFYCLYLELDPVALDVNVHPTKHEVRFRDARVIHAFLSQTLSESLGVSVVDTPYSNIQQRNNYIAKLSAIPSTQEIIGIIANRFVLVKNQENLLIIDYIAARKELLLQNLSHDLIIVPLVPGHTAKLLGDEEYNEEFAAWCESYGFVIDQVDRHSVILRSLPQALQFEKINATMLVYSLYNLWLKVVSTTEVYAGAIESVDFTSIISIQMAEKLMQNINRLTPKQAWCDFGVEKLQNLIKN